MAQAITAVRQEQRTPQEEQELAALRLRDAVSSNAEAINDGLALLDELHKSGTLQLFRAMFEQGNDVLKIVTSLATQPGYVGGIKNVIALVQGLSNFDSRALAHGFRAVANASEVFANPELELEPIGMFGIVEQLRDRDISMAMSALFTFLKGFGQGLREDEEGQRNLAGHKNAQGGA